MSLTLREFAAMVGLSPTTVSRALGGYPEVREETRARVEAAAREHGYRPNRRAAALATGRAMTIGHVIPAALGHEVVNPVFGDFVAGAGEVYGAAGYDMLMSTVSDGDEAGAYLRLAEQGAVDGVIVHGPRVDDDRPALLRRLGLPFVVHGRVSSETEPYDFVDVENARAFAALTDHLLDHGHRRIALLNGLEGQDFAARRREGFDSALAGRGLASAHLASSEMTEAEGFAAAAAMLDGPAPPTAFVTASLILALGVRRALDARGLAMGRDVSVTTHDDALGYIGNGGDTPLFTASRSSVRAAGRRCAEMLLARIADPGGTPAREVWPCPLVIGPSTGPAPR